MSKTAEEYLKQWHIQDITIVLLDNKRESFGRIRKVPKEVKLSELLSDYSRNTEQQLAEKDKEIKRYAIEFAEWFIKNTGKYTDDILALRQGKYIELYKQSLNK